MTDSKYNKDMALNQWVNMFKDMYFPTQNYSRSSTEIFVHLIKVYGGGSRYLFRTGNPGESRKYLAKIFGWYCALANRLGIDVEDALWRKYPGVCPRCFESVCNCEHPLNDIDPDRLNAIAVSQIQLKPKTLSDWQQQFGRIYQGPAGKSKILGGKDRLAVILSRMAEELGEVAEAILLDPVIDRDVELVIKNEMADLCAWIFALANNLHFVDQSQESTTLADVTWSLYGGTCHRCAGLPCVCVRGTLGLELAQRGAMGPAQWDDLTGLANANGFNVYFQRAADRYSEDQKELWVIMLDLDDFGQINKTYGHHAGDQVLKAAALRMNEALLDGAVAFRRGGEEFLVIVNSDSRTVYTMAEKIRLALCQTPVPVTLDTGVESIPLSGSLGISSTGIDACGPERLQGIADSRTREAKLAGKNQIRPEVPLDVLRMLIGQQQYL